MSSMLKLTLLSLIIPFALSVAGFFTASAHFNVADPTLCDVTFNQTTATTTAYVAGQASFVGLFVTASNTPQIGDYGLNCLL